jgi:hypothetical protein
MNPLAAKGRSFLWLTAAVCLCLALVAGFPRAGHSADVRSSLSGLDSGERRISGRELEPKGPREGDPDEPEPAPQVSEKPGLSVDFSAPASGRVFNSRQRCGIGRLPVTLESAAVWISRLIMVTVR